MAYNSKKRSSTPRGFKHFWGYHGKWMEKKVSPRVWRFTFRATKGKRSRSYGGFRKGFKIKWGIRATQTAVKTGKGKYQTFMKGKKTLLSTGGKKYRKKRYY